MKFSKTIIVAILFSSLFTISLDAQNKEIKNSEGNEILKGLTKATQEELSKHELVLDGESIPIYNAEGKRLRGQEMAKVMMSGSYSPDFYMNTEKEIKVAILRGSGLITSTEAPTFSVTDINGNNYALNALKGKVVVLNFWFIECKPCIMEIPDLNELVEKYKDEEVVFLGFATNNKSKLIRFLDNNNFTYNIIPNSRKVAKSYNVKGYPTHVIIDQNSKIAHVATGLSPVTVNNLDKTIEGLRKK